MEPQKNILYSFGIDDTANNHLISIAKWNKFLAIIGIVLCSLIILAILFGSSYFYKSFLPLQQANTSFYSTSYVVGVFVYIVMVVVFLVPCIFRLKFSTKMLNALATSDQDLFNSSLYQLKMFSKFWGILTVIIIAFYVIIILFFILTQSLF